MGYNWDDENGEIIEAESCIGFAQHSAITQGALGDPHLDALFDQNRDNVYYRFLYYLADVLDADLIVELGVCEGRSTAHMAAGCPKARVIAVDPEVHGALQGNALDHYANIDFRQCRSDNQELLDSVKPESVGLLFVDSVHNLPHVLTEMRLWLPKMKRWAPIIFDDLDYHWSMPFLLDALPLRRKGRLEGLHIHGFGYALAEPDLGLEVERTGHEELTVTYWRGNGAKASLTTKG